MIERPLKSYLDQIKSDHTRKEIGKKLKRILLLNTPETQSSTIDAFRLLGKATLQLQLVTELNKFIMEHVTSYMMITPWAKELLEYRELYKSMIKLSTEMSLGLIYQGQLDGRYTPDDTVCKDTQQEEAL